MKTTNNTLRGIALVAGLSLLTACGGGGNGGDGGDITPKDFIFTVKTDNIGISSDMEFTIFIDPTLSYDYSVDCDSDGTYEKTDATGHYTCDYSSAGTYRISIKSNKADQTGFPRISFGRHGDQDKLLGINQWGTMKWSSMNSAFAGCSNLNNGGGWANDAPDLSEVTDMYEMFSDATVFNQSLNGWDVSNVTDMSSMFSYATAFNQPLDGWDVGSVTDMSWMFGYAAAFNQPLDGWSVSNVADMESMFYEATVFNQPLNSWDVGSVTDMYAMFSDATAFNQPLNSWDVGSVTDMDDMFNNASAFANHDLSGWNVSKVEDHDDFFTGAGTGNTEPNW